MSLIQRSVGSAVILEAQPVTAPAVPFAVTKRQAKLALLNAGLLSSVQAAIDAIADEGERARAQITWDDSTEVQRDNPLVAQLSQALSLDSEALDALFTAAAAL